MKKSVDNKKINKLPPGHKYLDEIIYLQKFFIIRIMFKEMNGLLN